MENKRDFSIKPDLLKKIGTASIIAFSSGFSGPSIFSINDMLKLNNKQDIININDDNESNNTIDNISLINIDDLNFNQRYKQKDTYDDNLDELFVKLSKFYGIDSTIIENIYNNNYNNIVNSSNSGLKFIKLIEKYIKDNKIKLKKKTRFEIGTNNKNKIKNFKKTKMGKIYVKYGEMYGVDPDILIARDMQESGLSKNTKFNPGGATGPSQIEYSLIGSKIKAYNTVSKKKEIVKITKRKVTNLDSNIKLGTMRFANCLNKTHGNIYAALQWYNYGNVFYVAIKRYSKEKGISTDEVLKNTSDLGWKKYIDDIHNNPHKYINNWKYSSYGDNKYYKRILKNVYDSDNVLEFQNKGGIFLINLNSNKKISISNKDIKKLSRKR